MDILEREKINKIFNSLAEYSMNLIIVLQKIEQNKIMLDFLEYSSIEKINELYDDIIRFYVICNAKDKNFGLAIKLLFSSLEIIRQIGNFNNNFRFIPTTKGSLNDI